MGVGGAKNVVWLLIDVVAVLLCWFELENLGFWEFDPMANY
jgi:hypothetical protein